LSEATYAPEVEVVREHENGGLIHLAPKGAVNETSTVMGLADYICVCGQSVNFCKCAVFTPLTASTREKREARQALSDAEADKRAEARRYERDSWRRRGG